MVDAANDDDYNYDDYTHTNTQFKINWLATRGRSRLRAAQAQPQPFHASVMRWFKVPTSERTGRQNQPVASKPAMVSGLRCMNVVVRHRVKLSAPSKS